MTTKTQTETPQVNYAYPAAELVLTVDTPRQVWLQERTRGIGGSDIASILNLNQWQSVYELWLDKTGQGLPDRDSEAARWGREVEPVLAAWFTQDTGIQTRRAGLMRSKVRPWALANVDRLTADGGILEIKTTSWWMREQWGDDEDDVADYAALQTQWYLYVTGRSHAWVIAKISDAPPRITRVERDAELIEIIVEAAERFWFDHVQTGIAPTTTGALEAIKSRFPQATGETLTLTNTQLEEAQRLWAVRTAGKDMEKLGTQQAADAEAALRHLIGEAEIVADTDGVERFNLRNNGTFSTRRFAEEQPDLFEQLQVMKPVLDMDRLKTDHPHTYNQYRARVLRAKKVKGNTK